MEKNKHTLKVHSSSILHVNDVHHAFSKGDNPALKVLENVNFHLYNGEIVALLGRSGSGKSTLLRIMAGLVKPSHGDIVWQGNSLVSPAEGMAMVFQNFALFPWLTVLENVEIGLEALNVPAQERRRRALAAIDLIGLDGFESAYPKELSGGMRQRVGLARAFVVQPKLLLMDEPFSALDILTAETIRTDIMDLWQEKKLPIQSIFMVTHNIEEAVLMCDRAIILTSNQEDILREISINLPHPRSRNDEQFVGIVDDIYTQLTHQSFLKKPTPKTVNGRIEASIEIPLPHVSTNLISGLIELLSTSPFNGKADLPEIALMLQMEIDELFPIVEALILLHFAEIKTGDIYLTEPGHTFANMDVDERKYLFGRHLIKYIPLAALIKRVLEERTLHQAPFTRFSFELEDFMTEEYAAETLRAIIDWGRYAELFAYDEQSNNFNLDNPS